MSNNITSRHTGSGDVENDGVSDVVFVGAEKRVFRRTLLALREIQIRIRNGDSSRSYAQHHLLSGVDTTTYAKWDKVCKITIFVL